MSQRLFIAVELPDAVRAELARRLPPAGPAPRGLRWIDSSNWHITLRFLGSVQDEATGAVQEACASVCRAVPEFEMCLADAGAFPRPRRARVLWVGIERGAAPLTQLAETLFASTRDLGSSTDARDFVPHLTVARLRRPADVSPVLAAMEVPTLGFAVTELTLFRSELSHLGARYHALARYPLGTARTL